MRDFALSTRTTVILAAIVLATPLLAGVLPAEPQTPSKPYCAAEICASADDIATTKLDVGPDFVVHRFTLKDGSSAGVYVGGYPQRPDKTTPSTKETIDRIACERFDLTEGGSPSVALYCKWSNDFPTIIHAWASGSARPAASQAMALIRSMRHCAPAECPWPQ